MSETIARYDMVTRPVRWVVAPRGEPQFAERATLIEIDDEAAGEYVTIAQDDSKIRIDPEEWPAIRAAIETAFKGCLR